MNQLIDKAFEYLTITCNTSSLHPNDEDRIKVTLRTLHKNKVSIDIASLEDLLKSNNWQDKTIKNVVKWAKAVTSGGGVKLKHKNMAPTEKELWKKLNS
ncbi:DUF1889 family protein [Microbulbifer sp. SSSA002]|uniref:DUF1889 family protein n=1 Tax=unclassified Microbulbifer TaxID=2619833 RepID=UPI004039BEE5